jgi:Protein of unknown function (DUF3828)
MTMRFLKSAACSRRAMVFGLAVLLAAPVPAFAVAAETSPKAFLETIYQKYVGDSAKEAQGVPLENNAVIRRYFSAGLARLMLEDRANAKKKDDVPALDSDPFVGHQDWEITNLVIEVKENGPSKATGTVTFTNIGKPEKVVLELLNAGDGWRISDIQWSDGTLRALYRKK